MLESPPSVVWAEKGPVPLFPRAVALPLVTGPVIESGAGFIALLAHVPLAYIGCVVTCGLEAPRVAGKAQRIIREVVTHAVRVGIETAEHAGPAGTAERRGAERVGESYPFVGYAVDVGRL